jgi:hypothetical protein
MQIDYGWQDIEDFIEERKQFKKIHVGMVLIDMVEMFDLDRFIRDYERIKEMGFYIIELTQRYPEFQEYIINKYGIKGLVEEEVVPTVEHYSLYTEHDCEMFIGFVLMKRENLKAEDEDCDVSELDFIDRFIDDYESFGVVTYIPLTFKYIEFKNYMRSVYGSWEPTYEELLVEKEALRRAILFRKF